MPFCVVVAVLPEVAEEAALFVWLTLPLSPQLPMRIGLLLLDGASCTALEAARLPWSVWADWSLDWTPLPLPLQPHSDEPWFWLAFCVVVAVLPDVADEAALLVWLTLPSLPGLSTRTEMLLLLGAICFAAESAAESWPVPACWTDDCAPEPPWV